jgi:hypothetical protein
MNTMHDDEETGSNSPRGRYGPWVWTAYRAHNELLREKLKKRFEAQEGPWLDRIADLLVAIVNARWEGGRQKEKELDELFAKLDRALAE